MSTRISRGSVSSMVVAGRKMIEVAATNRNVAGTEYITAMVLQYASSCNLRLQIRVLYLRTQQSVYVNKFYEHSSTDLDLLELSRSNSVTECQLLCRPLLIQFEKETKYDRRL